MAPTMASIAGLWFPPMERSTMAGMYTSGNQLAATFGMFISSKLCEAESIGGWYSIFYTFGMSQFVSIYLHIFTVCVLIFFAKKQRLL